MADIKGPAVDAESFRVEGHCCGIRIPALQALTDEGCQWEVTPGAKAELVAEGIQPVEQPSDSPKAG